MKSILISINPQHAVNILNGSKTLELRKSVPKDFVGWVYMYVTKGKPLLTYDIFDYDSGWVLYDTKDEFYSDHAFDVNGKVVCRFWFDGNDYIPYIDYQEAISGKLYKAYGITPLQQFKLCLTYDEIKAYGNGKDLYAWHIKRLEIFDQPKQLSDFYNFSSQDHHDYILSSAMIDEQERKYFIKSYQLRRAPQSWQYIWVKEK